MIIKLQDNNQTIIDLDKVSFAKSPWHYEEDVRNGKCYLDIYNFGFEIGIEGCKLFITYSIPCDFTNGLPYKSRYRETWDKLEADYKQIESYLLNLF